jgi:hypothetical protein
MTRKNVPWRYSESGSFKKWEWKTKHFLVQIIDDGASMLGFTYNVIDTTVEPTKILKTDRGNTFKEVEAEMLEYVGKSWEKYLGYAEYAGDLIYMFETSRGVKENLKQYIGEEVYLTYFDETGAKTVQGVFGVKNHSTLLKTSDDKILVIPPLIIKKIEFVK